MPKKCRLRSKSGFFLAAVAAVIFAVCLVYQIWANTFDMKKVGAMPDISVVYDIDGRFYSRLEGEGLRDAVPVPVAAVSRNFIQALLALEDARFYKQHGEGAWSILSATARYVAGRPAGEGGGTIVQQLAHDSFPVGGGSLHGELLEAFVALRITRHYSKEQILARYINRLYFGSRFFGIEAASRGYFNKHASQLNLAESAMLAGILRGPDHFSPFDNPKGATARKDEVLKRMADLKMITHAEAQQQIKTPVAVSQPPPPVPQVDYAVDAVKRDLGIILAAGHAGYIQAGGLKIYTTLDPVLQEAAAAALEAQLRKVEQRPGYAHPPRPAENPGAFPGPSTPYLQGAVVIIDNRDGGIRAMVGGRDHADSPFNRARDLHREIASTFKPFVYAAAFQRGLLPGAAIDDSPIRPGEIKYAENWSPYNSDRTNTGIQPAQEGLILSRNTMSIRIGNYAGVAAVRKVATDAGIPKVPQNPYIYLGVCNGTLEELTTAYTIFPNDGLRNQPRLIERIDDSQGRVVYRAPHTTTSVLDPGVSWMVSSTLEKVLQRGTASGARTLLGFTKPAGGKTGTTDDYHDAWFVGYTKSLTCGVWVGFDTPVNITQNGYGAALALPIWTQIMNAAPGSRYPAPPLQPSVPLRHVRVCSITNELATTGCESAQTAYDIDLPASLVPLSYCRLHPGSPSEIPIPTQAYPPPL